MKRISLLCLILLLALCGSAQARTSKLDRGLAKAMTVDYGQMTINGCDKDGCLGIDTQWDFSNRQDIWMLDSLTSADDPKRDGTRTLWLGDSENPTPYRRTRDSSCFAPGDQQKDLPAFFIIPFTLMPFAGAKEKRIGTRRYQVRSARGWKPKAVLTFSLDKQGRLRQLNITTPKKPKEKFRVSFRQLDASPRLGADITMCS